MLTCFLSPSLSLSPSLFISPSSAAVPTLRSVDFGPGPASDSHYCIYSNSSVPVQTEYSVDSGEGEEEGDND